MVFAATKSRSAAKRAGAAAQNAMVPGIGAIQKFLPCAIQNVAKNMLDTVKGLLQGIVDNVSNFVSVVIGVTYGTIAGYFGGKLDTVMMRIVEILYAMPYLIFVIILMVIFGRNIYLLFLAIGAVEWLTMARIVRGQTISIKEDLLKLDLESHNVEEIENIIVTYDRNRAIKIKIKKK